MIVYAELLDTLGTSIDEAEQMLLPRLKLELRNTSIRLARKRSVCAGILHLAVDQIVVGRGKLAEHGVVDEGEVIGVEPILK